MRFTYRAVDHAVIAAIGRTSRLYTVFSDSGGVGVTQCADGLAFGILTNSAFMLLRTRCGTGGSFGLIPIAVAVAVGRDSRNVSLVSTSCAMVRLAACGSTSGRLVNRPSRGIVMSQRGDGLCFCFLTA